MAQIIPTILEKDFKEIKKKLDTLMGQVKLVHLDLADGVAVRNTTWPFASGGTDDAEFNKILNEEEGLPHWQDFDFELDLMVSDAVENFDLYLKLGPKRVIFSLSENKNLGEFTEFLEGIDPYIRDNVEVGFDVRPSDDLEKIIKLSHKVDFIHCRGSDEVGFQGTGVQFDLKALENIRYLKEKLPGIVISVDIGINLSNAQEILNSGADRLCIGSAIWRSGDPIGALQDFESLV